MPVTRRGRGRGWNPQEHHSFRKLLATANNQRPEKRLSLGIGIFGDSRGGGDKGRHVNHPRALLQAYKVAKKARQTSPEFAPLYPETEEELNFNELDDGQQRDRDIDCGGALWIKSPRPKASRITEFQFNGDDSPSISRQPPQYNPDEWSLGSGIDEEPAEQEIVEETLSDVDLYEIGKDFAKSVPRAPKRNGLSYQDRALYKLIDGMQKHNPQFFSHPSAAKVEMMSVVDNLHESPLLPARRCSTPLTESVWTPQSQPQSPQMSSPFFTSDPQSSHKQVNRHRDFFHLIDNELVENNDNDDDVESLFSCFKYQNVGVTPHVAQPLFTTNAHSSPSSQQQDSAEFNFTMSTHKNSGASAVKDFRTLTLDNIDNFFQF